MQQSNKTLFIITEEGENKLEYLSLARFFGTAYYLCIRLYLARIAHCTNAPRNW
jgi:hypothetical protein